MSLHFRLLQESKRFLAASRELSAQDGERWRFPVPHYLAGHAIELALKAGLAHGGMADKELRDLGHDLEAGLAASSAAVTGRLEAQHVEAIRMLNPCYLGKELEYPIGTVGTMMSVPEVRYLVEGADSIVAALEPVLRAEFIKKASP